MKLTRSPLAPAAMPDMPAIAGVEMGVAQTGMKYKGRPDALLVRCTEQTSVACVATQSSTASSAVHLCKAHAADGVGRLLLVNAGNSNAFTGEAGAAVTQEIMQQCAAECAIPLAESFMCSTGVIGELLPAAPITDALPTLRENLAAGDWHDAARAIMTTDTYAKCATATLDIDGTRITINGIAKGSGMVAPNMATMLAFFFTDAAIDPALLQQIFRRTTDKSFNCITVDSDTSTSDTGLIFATGAAGNAVLVSEEQAVRFEAALLGIMQDLAKQIVCDGEGAQKLITIKVNGAASDADAHMAAMAIANSPLVKTAIAGGDANWGRVVMAVGKSAATVDQQKLSITFGGQCAAKDGQLNPDYNEAKATEHLAGRHIDIAVDLGLAGGQAEVWTCDLTHGYIDINADYRS